VQRKKKRKKKVTAIVVAIFFLLWSYAAAHLHEEGDGSRHRLLLPAMELRYSTPPRRRGRQLPSPSSACYGATL